MPKSLKITLAVLLSIPLCCCMLPYGCLYLRTPTTYEYTTLTNPDRTQYSDNSIPGIEVRVWLHGDAFYARDDSGPTRVRIGMYKNNPADAIDIQITNVAVESSIQGVIPATTNQLLPFEMELKPQSWENKIYAHFAGDQTFAIDPASGESFKVTITLSITLNGQAALHELEYEFVPKRHRDPLWHFMPRV